MRRCRKTYGDTYTLSLIVGAQPSFSLIRVLSELRPRTPSGPGMWWMGSFLSSKPRTISAISFMLTISSLPMFTGSRKSDFVNLRMISSWFLVSMYSRQCSDFCLVDMYLPQNTLDTLVDKSEGSGLETVTPHLKPLCGGLGLPAEGSRCLLATTYQITTNELFASMFEWLKNQ